MRIVGGEHHRARKAGRHSVEARFYVLGRDEALAGEVLRRLHVQSTTVEPERLQVFVETVEVRNCPRSPAFEEGHPQSSVPLEDPVSDDAGECHHLLGDEVHGVDGTEVVPVPVLQIVVRHQAAHPRMEGEGHPGFGEVGPQRLVGLVLQGRDTRELLWPSPHASKPECLHAALGLGQRVIGVGHRERAHAYQTFAALAAVVGDPVVDGSAQRQRRIALGDTLDHESEGRIQGGHADNVGIHVPETGDGIGCTGSGQGHLGTVRRLARSCYRLGSPGDAKPDPVTADEVEVALVLEDARRITAKASRQVTVPHLCGLHHVTVGVEHPRRPNAAVTCSVSLADGPHEGAPA